jgi:folate-binding protein YgfZ
LIKVSGEDKYKFLQGLITQDIFLLDKSPLIYSCLLTPQGKFSFDFFISKNGPEIHIDCEDGDRANALLKRLSMFKLRSDVTLSLNETPDIWHVFGDVYEGQAFKDPRHELCGYRTTIQPTNIPEVAFDVWDEYRIKLIIPDGSRDLIPEKSFLHESPIVIKSGVSMTKGCYMGQELVSRMHHRGLAKKQLKCVDLSTITNDMELRSRRHNVGLVLVKVGEVD